MFKQKEPDWRKFFNEQFQPIQQELAALVSAYETRSHGLYQLGESVSRLEHEVRMVLRHLGYPPPANEGPDAAATQVILQKVWDSKKPAKVLPFKKRRKVKRK